MSLLSLNNHHAVLCGTPRRICSAVAANLPARLAASTIAFVALTVTPTGFSTMTCKPASKQATATTW
jgi:hypothetical protein